MSSMNSSGQPPDVQAEMDARIPQPGDIPCEECKGTGWTDAGGCDCCDAFGFFRPERSDSGAI